MTILATQIMDPAGVVGVSPRFIRIVCDNSYAEVTAAGFLLEVLEQGFQISTGDFVFMLYGNAQATPGIFNAYVVGTSITLFPYFSEGAMPLASGKLLVGDSTGKAAQRTISGPVSISNAGVSSLGLTDGMIYVGNSSNIATGVTMTGDVTINDAGISAIGAAKITKSMLSTGIRPSDMIVISGRFTTVTTALTLAIAAPGALPGDQVIALYYNTTAATGTSTRFVNTGTDLINFASATNPFLVGDVITYFVIRSTS